MLTTFFRTAKQYERGGLVIVGLRLGAMAWRRSGQGPGGVAPLRASPHCSYFREACAGDEQHVEQLVGVEAPSHLSEALQLSANLLEHTRPEQKLLGKVI